MDYASGERDFFRIERINSDFSALFEMMYAADKYDVVYRMKDSKKKLKITLPSYYVGGTSSPYAEEKRAGAGAGLFFQSG